MLETMFQSEFGTETIRISGEFFNGIGQKPSFNQRFTLLLSGRWGREVEVDVRGIESLDDIAQS